MMINDILVPLLRTYFGENGVLPLAPSNKAAREINGTTVHSGQGLTQESSLRTHALAPNAEAKRKLGRTVVPAGAVLIDEFSQLPAELNHAQALRSTYARESTYGLLRADYSMPRERFGRMAILSYFGDHLQLPPVPHTSSLLSSLHGKSNEHRVGAAIFRNAEHCFLFREMKRFTDRVQVQILETMRHPGGRRLTEAQWQALAKTEISAEQPDVPLGWYHACYCWSIVSMAALMIARQSAREHAEPLFFVQAIDRPARLPDSCNDCLPTERESKIKEFFADMLRAQPNATRRLPSFCMFHYNMRVRLTTTLAAPIAVQDVAGTVVGVELSPLDKYYNDIQSGRQLKGEMVLSQMPLAIYVKLDNCSQQFLPEGDHPGIFAVRPKRYTWKYFLDSKSGDFINVSRRQFALLPATACTLYSMQGTTAEPGLVAYWQTPSRATTQVRWLIVYVMLSRPRSLATLRSLGLGKHIREIIEGGPPTDLVESFETLFSEKIQNTKVYAEKLAKQYGLLPSLLQGDQR